MLFNNTTDFSALAWLAVRVCVACVNAINVYTYVLMHSAGENNMSSSGHRTNIVYIFIFKLHLDPYAHGHRRPCGYRVPRICIIIISSSRGRSRIFVAVVVAGTRAHARRINAAIPAATVATRHSPLRRRRLYQLFTRHTHSG